MIAILNRLLVDPGRSMAAYVARVFPIQLVGAIIIAVAGAAFVNEEQALGRLESVADIQRTPGALLVLFLLVGMLAPLLETVMMWPLIRLIQMANRQILVVAIISGVIWGLVHAINNESIPNGLAAVWSFSILTVAFQVGDMTSLWRALLTPFILHAMNNSVIVLLVWFAAPPP